MDAAQPTVKSLSSTLLRRASSAERVASISLVLPALNEREVIAQAIAEADEALSGITDDYEIVVVDDGSTDTTRQVVAQEALKYPAVRLVVHERNRGYGAALRSGFAAATKEYVGFTDADCQFHLPELNRLVLLLASCDIACGYRMDRQDGWLRNLYSRVYNFLVRLLLGTRVRDCDCALKLFRREALADLSIHTNGFLVNAELLSKASLLGKRVIEVGVSHRPRPRGQSTVNVWHTIPVFAALIRFWWSTVLFPARVTQRMRREEDWNRRWAWLAPAILCLLSAVIFFGNLSYAFIEPDESRYAQIALEMIQTGDYVVPRLNGEPYLDKPPLLYWITAASFQLFGVNEQAARLPSALAATLTVLATYFLGSRLLGQRVAFTGALMQFLCIGFVLSGRFVIMDGLLTLFTTISLLAGFIALRSWRLPILWWLLAALACGLGVLTKGPVALVLTVPPLAAWQWLSRYSVRFRLRHWAAFALVVAAVTASWFAVVGLAQPEFLEHFVWKHHIVRFVTTFTHEAPFWYYVPVLLIGTFPCSVLTAPLLAFLLGRSAHLRQLRSAELGATVIAAAWIILFFSLSSCKLPTYVLPAVPMLCLLAGCMLREASRGVQPLTSLDNVLHQLPVHATTAALVIGASIATVDLLLRPDHSWGKLVNGLVITVTLLFLIGRAVLWRSWSRRTANWLVAAGVSMAITAFAFQKFTPEFAGYRSIHANAAQLQMTAEGKARPVVYLDWQSDGYPFYLAPCDIQRFTDKQIPQLAQYLRSHGECLFVANPHGAERLQEELGRDLTLRRAPGARGRLYIASATRTYPTLGQQSERLQR